MAPLCHRAPFRLPESATSAIPRRGPPLTRQTGGAVAILGAGPTKGHLPVADTLTGEQSAQGVNQRLEAAGASGTVGVAVGRRAGQQAFFWVATVAPAPASLARLD